MEEAERAMIIDDFKEEFAFMDKSHTRDDEGNTITTWEQSEATFLAAIRFDSSVQAKRAQAEGVQDLYTIITGREVDLEFNDVVKRLEDGTTFRVTTSGKDNKTPRSASLNMRAVSAKVWEIPDSEGGGETE
jgi:head-tail adaptor